MATISEAFTSAVQHHRAGELQAAEQIYRQILAIDPNQHDVWHRLGVIACQVGKPQSGVEYFLRALALRPDWAEAQCNLGNAWMEQSKLDEAIACYQRALQLKPDFGVVHFNLGNAWRRHGDLDEAVVCYQRALQLKPDYAEAYNNLGTVWLDRGNLDEAVACFQRALQLNAGYAEAHNNLGNAWRERGKLEEAAACYRRALEVKPDHAEALNNLGNVWLDRGELDEAVACYQRALLLKPGYVEAHNNLGTARKDQGKTDEAMACFHRALQLAPDHAATHCNIGNAWLEQGKLDEAVACYQRALQLKGDYVEAHNNLGNAWKENGMLDDAVACYQRALQLKADYAVAHNNLGNAWKDQGLLDNAMACYRRALQCKSDYVKAHNNLIYLLYFCPQYDAQSICEEHRRWSQQHAEPRAHLIRPHTNDRSAERRLRIGYVSSDFRAHPVGRFILPLLEAHDHSRFEIFCYAALSTPDMVTQRCRENADVWRDVLGYTDDHVAEVIRHDRVDVLVDLTMHMEKTRLLVFARKPAPVQVTYLAYCGTTGLKTMDYRLTDPYLDPPGGDESCYAEQSVRLPETYWCYAPPAEIPEVNSLPALERRQITFGCLNNYCKVTAPTLEAWARILRALPESRLLLHAQAGNHRERARNFLAERGVSPDRLTFMAKVGGAEYFRTYGRIDVGLDPFPYGGGTTTCDALIMGVPVVSLAGKTAVGRGGLSILSNVGLAELVGHDVGEYERIAVELARDLPRLSRLRAGLRQRMQHSPLMNAERFARNIEAVYRELWQRWCATPT